jgi:serine/threonine protein kinase
MVLNENYQFIKKLGEGGFGEVVLARDVLSDRLVAIKWLKETDRQKQDSIIREIKAISEFNDPNIVFFYHHYKVGERISLVMEYCENGSLRSKLMNPLSPQVALPWFEILAETLHKVHIKGITHHDIKPDNILFNKNEEIKISDFGVANTFIGTICYMAPELFLSNLKDYNDPRIDIFALGITLLETLTGRNPFVGKTPEQISQTIRDRKLSVQVFPLWLQNIIYKSLDPTPEFRFQTGKDLAESIKAQYAPAILDTKLLRSGELAERANRLLKNRKWTLAYKTIEASLHLKLDNLSALKAMGDYYLFQNNINSARIFYEKLLHFNPRAEVHKELGWMQLETGKYRESISLLNDYLLRHPNDIEAHNLLSRCFYELGLYEQASSYLTDLISMFPKISCFKSNLFLTMLLQNRSLANIPDNIQNFDSAFINYNKEVLNEKPRTWDEHDRSSLKSKLLFQEYRFEKISIKHNSFEISSNKLGFRKEFRDGIISIGRNGYTQHPINKIDGPSISRRHFVIINSKGDTWLYDLSRLGTYVDGIKVNNKKFLHGLHQIKFGAFELSIKSDISLLI